MITLETLLGAAIGAGLSLAAEAGFGDQARSIKNRLTRESESARRNAFEKAFESASAAIGRENLDELMRHNPFREALIVGLLDPIKGFDVQSAASVCGDAFPMRAPAIQDFFADLRSNIRKDPLLGPLMKEFQELYFRKEVMNTLKETKQAIPTETLVAHFNARLDGSGSIAQGDGAIAAGENSIVVAGNVHDGFVVVHGDVNINIGVKDESPRFLKAYRERLMNTIRPLPLRGVEVEAGDPQSGKKRMDLDRVYVALDTTTQVEIEPGEGDKSREKKTRPLSVIEAAVQHQRLVVLGDPGSGKSTFLSHLALCLAASGLYPDEGWLKGLKCWPDEESGLIPVFVLLRDFARKIPAGYRKAEPRHLWEFIKERLDDQNLLPAAEPLRNVLEDGRAIVMLDGLDEIPSGEQRLFVRDAVAAFAECYDKTRVIVTCRVLSYQQDQQYRLSDYPIVELASFDEDKIDRFIGAWYADLERTGGVKPEETAGLARRLREAVRRPDIWRLAGNPLLLTVIALVHTHKNRLPDARALLYEETVDFLLWRWDQLRDVDSTRLKDLLAEAERNEVDLKMLLWRLAFQAHSGAKGDQPADIREIDLLKAFAALHPKNDYGWAQRVIQIIKTRSGLLLERSPEVFAFPHRTFQEYLAGAYLLFQADFPKQASALIERNSALWREVVLLAVGRSIYVSPDHSKSLSLAGELIPLATDDSDIAYRKAWMAGDVLLEIGVNRVEDSNLGKELLRKVKHRLAALIEQGRLEPRERVASGNVLSRLGDPRFNPKNHYLPDDENLGFIKIEAGPFLMGSDKKADSEADDDELPQHTVYLPEYSIARFPVTVAQYRTFAEETGHEIDEGWKKYNKYDTHPVVYVSWRDAVKYCEWLTEKLKKKGKIVRLPTEAEWEKAARGKDGRIYPCGEEIEPDRANYNHIIGSTSPVGCFPGDVSSYESMDMTGNVWEWCLDGRRKYGSETVNNPIGPTGGAARVIRGGAWYDPAGDCRAAYRRRLDPGIRYFHLGFRCVLASPGQQAGQGKG